MEEPIGTMPGIPPEHLVRSLAGEHHLDWRAEVSASKKRGRSGV